MINSFKKQGNAWIGDYQLYQVAAKPAKNGWRWVTAYRGKIVGRGAGVGHVFEALTYAVEIAEEHHAKMQEAVRLKHEEWLKRQVEAPIDPFVV